jgi:hypothetical protein
MGRTVGRWLLAIPPSFCLQAPALLFGSFEFSLEATFAAIVFPVVIVVVLISAVVGVVIPALIRIGVQVRAAG